MGTFNGLLNAEFISPRKWRLTQPLIYSTKTIRGSLELWRMAKVLLNRKLPDNLREHNNNYETIIDCENGDLIIRAPEGFISDLASVPRPLWWLIAPTDIARAAVIHDLLYTVLESYIQYASPTEKSKKYLKKTCDEVFYYAMLDSRPKLSMWKINSVYRAVSWFGWTGIKGY